MVTLFKWIKGGERKKERERGKEKKILKPPRPNAGFENLTFLGAWI
jgi:hypothetical protein